MPADIIILAAVAAFIFLRLRNILGHKMGHSESPPTMRDVTPKGEERVIQLHPQPVEITPSVTPAAELQKVEEEYGADIAQEVKKITDQDASFTMQEFLAGAKEAFDMVIKAFNGDDRDTLKFLLSRDLYREFKTELDQRKKQDEWLESTLIAVISAEPQAIEVEKHKARITVAFTTEQIQVTREKNGDVVEGSSTSAEHLEDSWVFEKDLRSGNPNWTIIDT